MSCAAASSVSVRSLHKVLSILGSDVPSLSTYTREVRGSCNHHTPFGFAVRSAAHTAVSAGPAATWNLSDPHAPEGLKP